MKQILALLFTQFVLLVPLYSQNENDSTKTPKEEEIKITSSELKKIVKEALEENKLSKYIGTIGMNNYGKKISLYNYINRKPQKVKNDIQVEVDSVYLNIVDGAIRDIRVYAFQLSNNSDTIKRVFKNKITSISLPEFDSRRRDALIDVKYKMYKDKDSIEYIILGDVIDYESRYKYISSNTKLVLDSSRQKRNLSLNKSLTYLLNIIVYSDFLALLGENTNGLIETETSFRIITNTQNLYNTRIIFFNYIKANFGFSKYDSKYTHTAINPTDSIDRLKLLNNSWLQYGFDCNVFNWWVFRNSNFFMNLDIGVQGYNSKVITTNGDSIESNLVSLTLKPQIKFDFEGDFGIQLATDFQYQSLKNAVDIKNAEYKWFAEPTITTYYRVNKNKESRVFFRYGGLIDLDNQDTMINKFQIGYVGNFSMK